MYKSYLFNMGYTEADFPNCFKTEKEYMEATGIFFPFMTRKERQEEFMKIFKDYLDVCIRRDMVPMSHLNEIKERYQELQSENSKLQQQIDKLKNKLTMIKYKEENQKKYASEEYSKEEKQLIKDLRNQVYHLQKENMCMKTSLKQKEDISKTQEDDVLTRDIADETQEEIINPDISIDLKVGFVAAFPEKYDIMKIKSYLPDAVFISSNGNIPKVDLIVFLTKHNKHKLYYQVKEYCTKLQIPELHTNKTNADEIIKLVYKHITKTNHKKNI